jgi:heme-degrading monooxygenase HmoA
MLARVVTTRVRPEKMDECVRIFRERNAPSIAAQPGFDHGHWWVDRVSGRATSVTFWTNAADERASRANIAGLVARMADVLASDEVDQEICEAVHDQHPPGRAELPTGTAAPHSGPPRDQGGPS